MKQEWDQNEFGIDWGAKAEKLHMPFIPKIQKHFFCAYHNVGLGSFYHRKEIIKIAWPDYQWHRWNERRLRGDCDYAWITWMGPAGSAKSTDAAVFGLEYWLEAPDRTAVIFCSTTMKMLRMRIWSQVAHYHQLLPKNVGSVGELLDSVTRIRWRPGDDKNGVFGMAVEDGPVEQIINDLIGIHTHRVLLILDEMQGVKEAIMGATSNMVANPVFRFRGMGNPDSLQNPLGKESEPLEGWDSVVRGETEEWETHGGPTKGNGLCQFFDGRKSPADDSPEERARLPWLCNKEWYDGIVKAAKGNLNDPKVWQFGIGWPPPMGLESTLLDDAILTMFHCKEKAVWTEGYIRCAAFDPARTGGDKRILLFGKRGRSSGTEYDRENRMWSTNVGKTSWVIECDEELEVPINVEAGGRPIDYQMVDFVKVECIKRGVPPEEFSLFSTGAGGPLLSIFREQWSPLVNGIEEGGAPSERVIDDTGKIAKDAYDTRASEILFNVREFAVSNGLRGLSNNAAYQLCARRTFYRNGKWCAEPKSGSKGRTDEKGRPVKGYKQRLGHSPDEGDAVGGLICHCMNKGAAPNVAVVAQITEQAQTQYNEWDENNYLKGYSFG